MNRRLMLQQMSFVAGAALIDRIVGAAEAGANLHAPPEKSRFTATQLAMLAQLAELIIPRTETAGAADAGVPAFIDHIVSEWYTPGERAIFVAGLASLDAHCSSHYKRPFISCDEAQRVAALREAERQASAYHPKDNGDVLSSPDPASPFFFKLKLLTVLGYYTSEVGTMAELEYNPAPGRYEGDFDFAKVGKQWAV